MSSSSGNVPKGLNQTGQGGNPSAATGPTAIPGRTTTATVSGNSAGDVNPNPINVPTGVVQTIVWVLASGLTWSGTGISIIGASLQPSLSGSASTGQYIVTYTNNGTGTSARTLTYNVSLVQPEEGTAKGKGKAVTIDPTIENQGGGGIPWVSFDPKRD
jgi:hypothetical protein